MAFDDLGLHPVLMRAVTAAGFTEPTPIQAAAIPPGLAGHDIVGLAQTGTGKTVAFLIPALQRLLEDPDTGHPTRVLVLTPTRELAIQVSEQAEMLTRDSNLRVTTVFGGRGMRQQTNALHRGTDIIVATPGRLLDHIRRRHAKLDRVKVLVIDEVDRMLDMGFVDDIRAIASRLERDRQSLLFGATLPPEIERLSRDFQRSPVTLEVARQKPPESIRQVLLPVAKHLKEPLLVHLMTHETDLKSALVFTETKRESIVVARQLGEAGISVALMHGDRRQADREAALRRLREGKARVLVATNVAARGLDIEDISHVVNYDMPQSVDEYVHRIGRTARAAATGKAYSFVTWEDDAIVSRIEAALERTLPREQVEGFDYDVPTPSWARPVPNLARPRGKADVSRSFRRR